MGVFNVEMRATLESGEELTIRTDQRDFYRWERTGNVVNDPKKQVEMTRFLAWHAAHRQGLTTLQWKEFDKVLVDAEDISGQGASGGGEEDPTIPTQ